MWINRFTCIKADWQIYWCQSRPTDLLMSILLTNLCCWCQSWITIFLVWKLTEIFTSIKTDWLIHWFQSQLTYSLVSTPTDIFAGVTDWLIILVKAKLQVNECQSQMTGLLPIYTGVKADWHLLIVKADWHLLVSHHKLTSNIMCRFCLEMNTCFSIHYIMIVMFTVSSVYTGECCKEYYDLSGQSHSPKWCSNYCCYDPSTLGTTYYCCSNDILRAGADMRDSFCIEWWVAHM